MLLDDLEGKMNQFWGGNVVCDIYYPDTPAVDDGGKETSYGLIIAIDSNFDGVISPHETNTSNCGTMLIYTE